MFEDGDSETGVAVFVALALAFFVTLLTMGVAVGTAIADSAAQAARARTVVGLPVAVPTAPAMAPAQATVVSLLFDSSKSELPVDALTQLAPLIVAAKGNEASRIDISGYHDETGDAAKNAALAKQRAIAVRDLLLRAGVPQEKIQLAKPRDPTGGADAQQARRVDVYIP